MNCKHVEVKGNTTKYFYCKLKGQAVDDYKCKDCMMRLHYELTNEFETIFSKKMGGN